MRSSASFVTFLRVKTARRWLSAGSTSAGPSFEYRKQSEDDPKLRKTCTTCGFVNYENPKVVCGSVLTMRGGRSSGNQVRDDGMTNGSEDLFLLGRRTINPRRGFWGIPAGFQELGETGEEGAAREAREEMNAEIAVGGLLAVYCLPHIGQTQMIYSSTLKNSGRPSGTVAASDVSAGQETDEVMFVRWEDIPWDELAFPTTSWALCHQRLRNEATATPSSGCVDGSSLGSTESARKIHGRDVSAGVRSGTKDSTSLYHADIADRAIIQLGSGSRLSEGTVFSTPSTNSSLFWCPERGLHLKDGWSARNDS